MALPTKGTSRLPRLAGRAVAVLVARVHDTSTVVVEPENARQLIDDNDPFVFAMWHGQFMMLPALHTGDNKVSAIVARHGDAEAIAEVLSRFNIALVRGAGAGSRLKDRGGAQALRTALKLLEQGSIVALTADVPPGPARRAGEGIVTLARLSGRPVVPFAAATSRYLALRTWSRMTINLPYGRLAYVIGDPIHVPRDIGEADVERYRLTIEEALNRATRRAYELAGADPSRATPRLPLGADDAPPPPGLGLKIYRAVSSGLTAAAPVILKVRERRGKEDPKRRQERFGNSDQARPVGPLAWFHAASVGELNAIVPLVKRLLDDQESLNVLVTTGTVTSAGLAGQRLPPRCRHQYVPLDAPAAARRFLDHWRPNLVAFTESEIWPNLVLEVRARKIPLLLVNARLSPRSIKRWLLAPASAAALFGSFDAILAQNDWLARAFRQLGGRRVEAVGNLKIDAPPPPADMRELERLKEALGQRPVFVAASTHEGEEEIVAEAHRRLARDVAGLCTIIAPRHPERGTAVTERLKAQGFLVAQRSLGALPGARTDIYVADSIGELGTFFALSPVALIGGSLVDRGGQNPVEAIGHGAVVLTGPSWRNFRDVYRTLLRHKGAIEVASAEEIRTAVAGLLNNESELVRLRAGARTALLSLGGALDRTVAILAAFLPRQEELRRAS